MPLTASERSARARIGGLVVASRHAGREITAKARATFNERFRREALEAAQARGEELADAELERRAQAGRRAYYARLGFESVKARSRGAAIGSLRLPARIESALYGAGLKKIRQVVSRTDAELLALPGIGSESVRQIRSAIWRWENGGGTEAAE